MTTRPIGEVNLFELDASKQVIFPQITSNDQLAHVQDRLKWALSKKELSDEYLRMENRLLQPLSTEEWAKDHNENRDFHAFMMSSFSTNSPNQ